MMMMMMMMLWFFPILFLLVTNHGINAESYQNVYGQTLQSCSSEGMALTGYTRNGYCVDEYDDQGSHHICIDLSSTSNNNNNEDDNFCTVTGQSDWCSNQDMPCHDNPDRSDCAIQNWCVCQWAFASYLQNAGGCDSIQSIVCDSINLQALLAYQTAAQQQDQKYVNALDCIVNRCGLTEESLVSGNTNQQLSNVASTGSSPTMPVVYLLLVGIVVLIGTIWVVQRLDFKVRRKNSDGDNHLLSGTK